MFNKYFLPNQIPEELHILDFISFLVIMLNNLVQFFSSFNCLLFIKLFISSAQAKWLIINFIFILLKYLLFKEFFISFKLIPSLFIPVSTWIIQ